MFFFRVEQPYACHFLYLFCNCNCAAVDDAQWPCCGLSAVRVYYCY